MGNAISYFLARRRRLFTWLLCLPALGLLCGFWVLASWNIQDRGFTGFPNWAASPDWQYHLGDLPRTDAGLPGADAKAADWTSLNGLPPSEAVPPGYTGVSWFRATLPETLRGDGLHLYIRGFKAVQVVSETRSVYDFNMEPYDFKVNKRIRWGLAPLEPSDFGEVLYVRAYHDGTSPGFGSLLIGKADAFYLDMMRQDVLRVVLCILFLFFSVSSFLLFAVNAKDPIYFHFAVLTACAAYGSMVRSHTLQLFADLPIFVYLQDVVFTVGAGSLIGFLSCLYSGGTRKLLRAFAASLWAYAAAVCVVALYHEPLYHFLIDYVLPGILCVYMSVALFLMLRSYRRSKDRETAWVFAGIVLLLLFAAAYYVQVNVYPFLHLIYARFPFLAVYLSETQLTVGVFLFVLCLGAVLILRYGDTQRQVKRYAAELAENNRRLQQLDKMKDDFLARTSHELRTPLFGITGMAEALLDRSSPTETEDRRRLSLIVASGRRLTRLVNDILDLSKLQHNDLRLSVRPTDIRKAAESVAALLLPGAQAKGLSVRCSFPEELPLVMADEDRVEQILFNLAGNAVKFASEGTVTISASPVPAGDGRLWISVADEGAGIPEEDLERIFERFGQSRLTLEQGIGGTGLGLAISKQLAELHGGRLTVRSKLGEGSTFTFSLPVCPKDAADPAEAERATAEPAVSLDSPRFPELTPEPELELELELEPEPNPLAGPRKTVLIVDDEPANLEVLAAYLSPLYRAVAFTRPVQALKALNDGLKPDLIVTDAMMPGMSGCELCRTVRETWGEGELPIVMLTARSMPDDLAEGFRSGANDYVTKPVSKQELLARVNLHLKLTELNRSLEEKVRERTEELERRNLELHYSIQETMDALEEIVALEERSRIAHEIHDSVGHSMTAAVMQLEATKRLLPIRPEAAMEKLAAAQGLIRGCFDQIRSAVRMLKDDAAHADLKESLVKLMTETEALTGVAIEHRIGSLPELPPLHRTVIFHALQEGLTNGLKHGGGSKFDFRLLVAEGSLLFSLKNNGAPYGETPFGFGLSAMRERVTRAGGRLRVSEAPGWGCDLQISLPI